MSTLGHAYHHRRAQCVAAYEQGGWRLKVYALAAPDKGVRPALLQRTVELAHEVLAEQDGHGAAFAIAHDAAFPIALVYWWQSENELHQRIYVGRPDDPTALDLVEHTTPTGCVWELGVVEHERRAWIDDVIGNPAGPDLDAWFARRFDGLV